MLPDVTQQTTPESPWQFYARKKGYDPVLVEKVWKAAENQGISPSMVVSMVAHESGFKTNAMNTNTNRTTDWGLFQLNSQWHNQFRNNIDAHIQYGVKYIADNVKRYGTLGGLAIYNAGTGTSPKVMQAKQAYLAKVLGSYKDMENTMQTYKVINPTFKMSIMSQNEIARTQGGNVNG